MTRFGGAESFSQALRPGEVWKSPGWEPKEPEIVRKARKSLKKTYKILKVFSKTTEKGGLQEWLDINGNGEVCKDECRAECKRELNMQEPRFIQGDLDTGPPFADFSKLPAYEQQS